MKKLKLKNKFLLAALICLLPAVTKAQTPTDDTFTVSDLNYDEDITWYEGSDEKEGAYYFIVSLSGVNTYSACNLSITLPSGISVIYDDDEGEYLVSLNNTDKVFTNSHTLGCEKPDMAINVAIYSGTNKEFKKTSGMLFNVYVKIDEGTLTSSFSPKPLVKLSGLNLTTSEFNLLWFLASCTTI